MAKRHESRKSAAESTRRTRHAERFESLCAFDNAFRSEGFDLIAGVDEAGRGALAGPVGVAAVVLRDTAGLEGVFDSKQLSESVREKLFDRIVDASLGVSIAFGQPGVIDRENILGATLMAMHRAVDALRVRPDLVLIDGRDTLQWRGPQRAVTGGDARSLSIAAASVLAKVARDRVMRRLSRVYPDYGFEENKGYGTAEHVATLDVRGPVAVHRRTFLSKIVEKNLSMF